MFLLLSNSLLMFGCRQYETVPDLRQDDNVIPQASEIPAMLSSLSHPRKRTVSIGPQSQADVYEAIAVRQRRRRDSEAAEKKLQVPSSTHDSTIEEDDKATTAESSLQTTVQQKQLTAKENSSAVDDGDSEADEELFSALPVPRVRYDVEVVTRLVVYFGMRL